MKKSKIDLVIKVLLIIMVIVPLIMFSLFNIILKDYFDEYNSTNFILFSVIEIINLIMLTVFMNNKITTNKFLIIIICYLTISALIPVFNTERTYAPIGPGSELMGLAIEKNYRDIYGINITGLVDFVK